MPEQSYDIVIRFPFPSGKTFTREIFGSTLLECVERRLRSSCEEHIMYRSRLRRVAAMREALAQMDSTTDLYRAMLTATNELDAGGGSGQWWDDARREWTGLDVPDPAFEAWLALDDEGQLAQALAEGYRFAGVQHPVTREVTPASEVDFGADVKEEYREQYRERGRRLI